MHLQVIFFAVRIFFKHNPLIFKSIFTGGFLAYYLMNKDIDLCLKCGIYCAREIIKKTGCNFENIKFDEQSLIDLFNPKN